MGEAKRRQKRLQKMQADQPWCIYCGGGALGTSVDHMPPITVCDLRQRPSGLEFLACQECHDGTRKDDQIAGIICRVFPDPPTEAARTEVRTLMRGLSNNQPDIIREWQPTPAQLRFGAEVGRAQFEGAGALNIGEKTHRAILRFGARAAAALHFAATGKIVPKGGAIWSTWHTNERLIKGDFPAEFADMLPPHTTLGAGTKRSLEGQFDYSSNVGSDGLVSVHQITFRLAFAIQAAVSMQAETFNKIEDANPQHIFRPGFLKGSRL